MNLDKIQRDILHFGGDGWLFCDIENRDKIAYRILNIDSNILTTRRWFYFIPMNGEPVKIVHKIEKMRLDSLPGRTLTYVRWQELHNLISKILVGHNRIFMQYSPLNNLPLISFVDAGTVDLVRSFGIEVVSSADLIQIYEARLDEEQISLHVDAGHKVQKIKNQAFNFIGDSVKKGVPITEFDVQSYILQQFEIESLTCEGLNPIVAVNEHAADPHFEPTVNNSFTIKYGDRILIDLWAKIDTPKGIYYDITWCGYVGDRVSKEYIRLFQIAVEARNKAKQFILDSFNAGKIIYGWEVDDVVRNIMKHNKLEDFIIHRTGHSIHTSVHGNGANLDNLETKDDRRIIAGTCFSIEPGIYKEGIGVRSEINVLVDNLGDVRIVGEEQEHLIQIG